MFNPNKLRLKYFLIPFISLMIIFFFLTFIATTNSIKRSTNDFEAEASRIAMAYSNVLAKSNEAYTTITKLLDDKLVLSAQGINQEIDMATNTSLQQLADKYYVDDIHYYNANREIILSNVPEYIGWQVPTDHPINDILNDTGDFLIEDIRKDTEGNDFFKYAYLRQKDNYFLQIGLLADDVHQILQSFELEGVIDDILLSTDVSHISFISNDSHIIASSIDSIVGTKYHSTKNPTGLTKVNDTRAFHINVPVFEGERKIGTLSIYWPLSKVRKNISSIVITGIVLFFIVFGISSLILIYAYKLNK